MISSNIWVMEKFQNRIIFRITKYVANDVDIHITEQIFLSEFIIHKKPKFVIWFDLSRPCTQVSQLQQFGIKAMGTNKGTWVNCPTTGHAHWQKVVLGGTGHTHWHELGLEGGDHWHVVALGAAVHVASRHKVGLWWTLHEVVLLT